MAVAGGVTTANIMPGSRQRHRRADRLRQAARPHHRGHAPHARRRPRRPEDGQRREPQVASTSAATRSPPGTRMKLAAMQREQFVKAREYQTQVGRLPQGEGRRQGVGRAGTRPRPGAARRGAGTQAHRPLPQPPGRRPDDAPSAWRRSSASSWCCSTPPRATASPRSWPRPKIPVLADADRQPRRQAGGGGPARGERRRPRRRPASRSRSTPTTPITESRFFLRTGAIAVRGGMTEDSGARGADDPPRRDAAPRRPRSARWPRARTPTSSSSSGAPFRVYTQVVQTWIDGETPLRPRQAARLDLSGGRLRPGRRRPPAADAARWSSRWPRSRRPRMPQGREEGRRPASKQFAVLAGRIHTVERRDDPRRRHPRRGRQDRGGRHARRGRASPTGTPVADGGRRHAGPDRRRRAVVGLSRRRRTCRPTRTRTRRPTPTRPTCACSTASTPTSRCWSSSAARASRRSTPCRAASTSSPGQTGVFRTIGRTAEAMAIRFPAGAARQPRRVAQGGVPGQAADDAHGHRGPAARRRSPRPGTTTARRAGKEKPPADAKLDALAPGAGPQAPGDVRRPPRRRHRDGAAAGAASSTSTRSLHLATEGYLMADEIAAGQGAGGRPPDDAAGRRQHGDAQQPARQRAASWRRRRSRWRSAPASRATSPRRACCATRRRWRRSTAWATTGRWRRSRSARRRSSASPTRAAASRRARSPTWCCTTATASSTPRT